MRRTSSHHSRQSGGKCGSPSTGFCVVAIVLVLASPVGAQDLRRLKLELTRPDAEAELLTGRLLTGRPEEPPDDRVHSCGALEIALTKVTYTSDMGGRFNYYLVLRQPNAPWEEWQVGRNDTGQFVSAWRDTVKVYLTQEHAPDCADFKMPVYCLAGCKANRWWSLSDDAPKTLVVYLGGARFWDLLLKKNIPFEATIANPTLSLGAPDLWDANVVLASAPAAVGTLRVGVTPRWTRLQQILQHQDGLQARITYEAQVTDAITKNISVPEELTLPVVIKPVWWLLSVPVIFGAAVALLIRRLAWNNVRQAGREWFLATVVAVVFLLLAHATKSSVEVATYKITGDSIVGAAIVGLSTGLAGRRAVDKLYRMLGVQEQ